ncbi:hypothetical protein DL96DRAFT_1597088 [Flagelloscypha sp. PMI_526]|nr:hypothetical protein DL96DRAFT_1597088 [Flagelloscypha sp. PMI_526]
MVFERSSTRLNLGLGSFFSALLLSQTVSALPTWRIARQNEPGILDDVVLFDAPAVLSDPPKVEMQAYVFVRQLDLGFITDGLGDLLGGLGLGGVADATGTATDRIKLFATIPRDDQEVGVTINGCGKFNLGATVDGVSITNVTCTENGLKAGTPLKATANLDTRDPTSNIFPSTPDGFGVISDLDDTIKISNVLDKVKLAKATLIDDPQVVGGMPELYKGFVQSLDNPLFSYVSGSPYQLIPFVQSFIQDNYPDGPKFLRNLTVFDIPNLIETLTDEFNTFNHKLATIDRLMGLYPQKKFLMIGDSTEKDPETYAEAFRKYGGDRVQCIWIREVDGAENSAERFATAFKGVTEAKIRTFVDSEIASLADINVKGGEC